MKKVIKIVSNLLPVVAASLMLTSCGGDGDSTVENWIVTVLFLLACMKRG